MKKKKEEGCINDVEKILIIIILCTYIGKDAAKRKRKRITHRLILHYLHVTKFANSYY
jgi:hypothetical protein